MSESRVIYVGPYFTTRFEIVTKNQTHRACWNDQCALHERAMAKTQAFCSACGNPLVNVVTPTQGPAVPQWEVEEVRNILMAPPYGFYWGWATKNQTYIWMPIRDGKHRKYELTTSVPTWELCEIDGAMILAEKAEFATTYHNERKLLKERYGNIAVCWGSMRGWE